MLGKFFSKIIHRRPAAGRLGLVGPQQAEWIPVGLQLADWPLSAHCGLIGSCRPTVGRLELIGSLWANCFCKKSRHKNICLKKVNYVIRKC